MKVDIKQREQMKQSNEALRMQNGDVQGAKRTNKAK
jgi:hypothetical protein